MRPVLSRSCCVFALLLATSSAFADAETRGPFGINVPDIGFDGSGIDMRWTPKTGRPDKV